MPPSAQNSAAEGEVQSIFRGSVQPEVPPPPKIPCLVFMQLIYALYEKEMYFWETKAEKF